MARKKHPRRLRADEEALWRQVTKQATPLHPERRAVQPSEPQTPPTSAPKLTAYQRDFRIGQAAPQTAPHYDASVPLSQRIAGQPVNMDAKAFGRMKRGKLGVDRRIDLHGMTLAEAHPRLISFILAAHADGKRLVLVITGKGRDHDNDGPIPARRGALRHQVPGWLTGGALRQVVLQISEAHRSHGGSGAFYVYLRRKGK